MLTPCFLSSLYNPYKGHSLLRPSFISWWEEVGSVVSGHSVAAAPLNPKGHSLPHVGGHRCPKLVALWAVPGEGAKGTGCHHARQGMQT